GVLRVVGAEAGEAQEADAVGEVRATGVVHEAEGRDQRAVARLVGTAADLERAARGADGDGALDGVLGPVVLGAEGEVAAVLTYRQGGVEQQAADGVDGESHAGATHGAVDGANAMQGVTVTRPDGRRGEQGGGK